MRNVKLLWGIIVSLLAVSLVLARMAMSQEGPSSEPAKKATDPVAKIGGQVITYEALEEKVYQQHAADLLNQMLDRRAVQMEADERKIGVSEEEIKQEILRMQAGYESEEQFYRSMKEQVGISREQLKEDVFYKLLAEKAATKDIVVSETEVSEYIKAHPDEFADNVKYHIQQIVNDTWEQADRTYTLARSGSDFSTLAKERSLDVNTAGEGGDLGWIEENDPFVPASILKEAGKMKPGEVSLPIKTDMGYTIIKLVDRKVEKKGDPEEIKANVKKQLALQKAPVMQDYIASLRKKFNAVIVDPELVSQLKPEGSAEK